MSHVLIVFIIFVLVGIGRGHSMFFFWLCHIVRENTNIYLFFIDSWKCDEISTDYGRANSLLEVGIYPHIASYDTRFLYENYYNGTNWNRITVYTLAAGNQWSDLSYRYDFFLIRSWSDYPLSDGLMEHEQLQPLQILVLMIYIFSHMTDQHGAVHLRLMLMCLEHTLLWSKILWVCVFRLSETHL